MFRRKTNHGFKHGLKTLLLIMLPSLAVWTAACSKIQPGSASSDQASAGGNGEFEGVISMKLNFGRQKDTELTYFIRGRQTRVETKLIDTAERGVLLMDLENGKMTTLIVPSRMYMTMDLKQAAENLPKDPKPPTEESKFPKLTPTGRKETVAGHACEHWLMGEQQEFDLCVAKGLGFFGMENQMGPGSKLKNLIFSPKLLAESAAHPELTKFLEGGAFPLKLTAKGEGGDVLTMEATKIQRRPLADSLFTIPPGYTEFALPHGK